MFKKWVVLLAVTGVAYVSGNQCDIQDTGACYDALADYETSEFPLYGENEAKLDDTCGNMNMSFNCIGSYIETCHGNEDCDANCTKLIKLSTGFLRITGLLKLHDNLCDKGNALRQTYLENAECLGDTADFFAACHNISEESRLYMNSRSNTVEAHCCYLSWYKDCFTNTTRTHCGENAAITVSIMAEFLTGQVSDKLCSSEPVFCDKPPLPSDEPPADKEADKTDDPGEDEADKDKPVETDNGIHNTTDNSENTAMTLYASTALVLPYVFSILFQYVL